ncbi:MAG: hypothetical protein A2Y95_01225 [Deltaproteobacteria bacterium RBG_13_65_10]|nr:MAG: hypothetical protein A2Y95_01225 [Deltaproteobacteria bacterium RBG_13_65_10]
MAAAPVRITLSSEGARYVQAGTCREVKLEAARGGIDLGPAERLTIFFLLAQEGDSEICDAALASLEAMPLPVVLQALDVGVAFPVLDLLARRRAFEPALLERIASIPTLADATLAFLAGLPHKRLVEIIASDPNRIVRSPAVVEALGANPFVGQAVIDRILASLGIEKKLTPMDEDADAPEIPWAESPVPDAALVEAAGVADDATGDLPEALIKEVEQAPNEAKVDEHNLLKLVTSLTVFQKVKLARVGNKEARGLLLRDRNKIVATAVIRSPKITENEIVSCAKSRNVNDDVIRVIASNREWTRDYQVQLALVGNPKTPLFRALKLINYLQEKDLRGLAKSKDIPRQVSIAAHRLLAKKKGDT